MVSDHAGALLSNGDNVRLVKYGVLAVLSSIRLEIISGKTIEYIDHYHHNVITTN